MKFDKDIVLGIVICAGVLIAWDPFCKYMGWIPEQTPAAAVAQSSETAQGTSVSAAVKADGRTARTVPVKKITNAVVKLPDVELGDKLLTYRISPVSGSVDAITLKDYKNAGQTGPVILNKLSASSNGALAVSGSGAWQLENIISLKKAAHGCELARQLKDAAGQSFRLTQNWSLDNGNYSAKYDVLFSNPGKTAVKLSGVTVSGGDLPPWHVISGDKVRIPSHRMDYLTTAGKYGDVKADKKDSGFFVKPQPSVRWVSLSNKYFVSILKSESPFKLFQKREFLNDGKDDYPLISAGADLGDIVLAPGESKRFSFTYYSGPKIIADLDKFDSSTGKVMHLAWGPLDYLARLLLWLLVKFHALLGSYGWSIVLLTLVVRVVFYPLTARGNASMRKMQTVQPMLKDIREKYKDNPQLMNTKMMELYRKEGVNPLGGCLPILLQIPVFFALYATLDGAVELRQVSFLWCKDLAAADTVARIPLYFFSLPVNPLVLAMTALMVIQQHMTPMSMDPMQKKMMALMPVIMLFMLYDLPSGLTLYWTVSNFFSIIQLKLQQKARAQESQNISGEKTGTK